MSIHECIGYYTYRSFLDKPVGAPSDILWGEGELLLHISDEGGVSGTLAFPATAAATTKSLMDLVGNVSSWSPLSFRFVGKGREGTDIKDFEYEYDCRVAYEWNAASPPQRLSLVGTVRRNKDHGNAKAGATASFIAVKRDFVEPRDIDGVKLIPEAVAMLSDRVHRLRHTVWHTLRNDWWSPKMIDADRIELRKLGWGLDDPPRDQNGRIDLANGAGEDFLYMHRRMIKMVHDVYDKAGKPRPSIWKQIPGPALGQFVYVEKQDPTDPTKKSLQLDTENSGAMVPPPTKEFMAQVQGNSFFEFNKSPRGYSNLMQHIVSSLRSPRVLAQLTLGAYGNLIEFTVHNWMHMRWATISRNPVSLAPQVRTKYDVDSLWDDSKNDYLGDFHSSHVNPLFWKLHGWVDDCVDAWFAAHEVAHPGQVKRATIRGIDWFQQGAWVLKSDPFDWPQKEHDHGHGGHHQTSTSELEDLLKVIALLKQVSERTATTVVIGSKSSHSTLPGFAMHEDSGQLSDHGRTP